MRKTKLHDLWGRFVWILIVVFLCAACVPNIALSSTLGGPGMLVTITGADFSPETLVSVRLGPPNVGATPQSYGDAVVGTDGTFTLAFAMPERWPDGAPIMERDLVVVVLNQDGSIKATAPFTYISSSSIAATEPPDADEDIVLTWHREGGIAGFCDDLVVYVTGQVRATSCKGNQSRQIGNRYLSTEQTDMLNRWVETYKSFAFERSDEATADGMRVRMTFSGNGTREATEAEKQVIREFLVKFYEGLER